MISSTENSGLHPQEKGLFNTPEDQEQFHEWLDKLPDTNQYCLIAVIKDKEGKTQQVVVDKGGLFSRGFTRLTLLLKYLGQVQFGSVTLFL